MLIREIAAKSRFAEWNRPADTKNQLGIEAQKHGSSMRSNRCP
jgi:hypothetical protein